MASELVKELRSIGTEKKKHEPMEYHPYKDETEMRLMIYNFKIYSHIVQDILPNQKVGKWKGVILLLARPSYEGLD